MANEKGERAAGSRQQAAENQKAMEMGLEPTTSVLNLRFIGGPHATIAPLHRIIMLAVMAVGA